MAEKTEEQRRGVSGVMMRILNNPKSAVIPAKAGTKDRVFIHGLDAGFRRHDGKGAKATLPWR